MAKRRANRQTRTRAAEEPATRRGTDAPRGNGTSANLAWFALCAALTLAFAWLTRDQISPDGVAYLDLAERLRNGDTRAFIQGYWSPLFPTLLAGLLGITVAIPAIHVLLAAMVMLGAAILYRGVRETAQAVADRGGSIIWLHAIWVTYIIASLGLVRLSAVTPDLLLLVALTGVVRELLLRAEPRWLWLGMWFGVAFLAKTSVWPWLLVAVGVLAWRYPAVRTARSGARLLVPLLLLVAAWVAPLSARYGRFTMGSTASLNACWYHRFCDGRSPDTHGGEHRAYSVTTLPNGQQLTYASFEGQPWTYAPWSDPTAWRRGIVTQRDVPLTIGTVASILRENTLGMLVFTLSVLYLGPVAAVAMHRVLGDAPTQALLRAPRVDIALLGAVGLAQFVAVHVEPRLMGPFAFLHVAALVLPRWTSQTTTPRAAAHPWMAWLPMATVGAALVAVMARELNYEHTLSLGSRIFRDEVAQASITPGETRPPRIAVVVGNAFPLLGTARALGVRIVGQVLPKSADYLRTLSPSDRQAVLLELVKGRAPVAWEIRADGRTMITRLR